MQKTAKQPLKNLFVFNLDASSSMHKHTKGVIKLFNQQVEHLTKRGKELEQENRIFVFCFADEPRNLVWDTDVLRAPNIEEIYKPYGNTALIDSTLQIIKDIKQIPEFYCDYSALIITISDGVNNIANHRASELREAIQNSPSNWTFAYLAPDKYAEEKAKSFGFTNIQLWDVSSAAGLEEMGKKVVAANDTFLRARSAGAKSVSNLFSLNTAALDTKAIKTTLNELKPTEYSIYPVHKDCDISSYVESWTKTPYTIGSGYYQLTKPEKIQSHKQIIVQDKANGKIYSGPNARTLLGLPDHEVRITKASHPKFEIFIQSKAPNRKLLKGSSVIVLK